MRKLRASIYGAFLRLEIEYLTNVSSEYLTSSVLLSLTSMIGRTFWLT